MLKKELLDILCCPKCKGDLQYDHARETLTCKGCRLLYPIRNGIPIMLESAAIREQADAE